MRRIAIAGSLAVTLVALSFAAPARAQDVSQSFSRYLLYTNHHTTQGGTAIWFLPGAYFDGWVHTNDEFRFAGNPVFADSVTCCDTAAWFYNHNAPVELDAAYNDTIDVPVFQHGFTRGVAPVPLPTDGYAQQNAALGLAPVPDPPSNAQINTALGLGSGSSAPPNGIYVPNDGVRVTGGIYVQGNADQIAAAADTINTAQVFVFKQGATTKTISIDRDQDITTVTVGAVVTTYFGAANGVIYVNGTVSDLRGPSRVGPKMLPALFDDASWSIVAPGDITIQRDLMARHYATSEATLGLFSIGGDVLIGTAAPNDLHIDAYVIAAGSTSEFRVENYDSGSPRGTVYLRGGCVEQYYGAFSTFNTSGVIVSGYARDFRYDRRGQVPPNWPTTAPPVVDVPMRGAPDGLRLANPWPNPSHGLLRIRYTLPHAAHVRLDLFDTAGRRIASIVDAEQQAGEHDATWSGRGDAPGGVRPGLYFVRLEAGGTSLQARVALVD